MLNPLPTLKETPSQTAGPYVHIGLTPNFAEISGVYAADLGVFALFPESREGRIEIVGRLLDGSSAPLSDAVVELWQADASGVYVTATEAPASPGWGRQATNSEGGFSFATIKPGRLSAPDGTLMAPHVLLWIVARGINIGLQTRLYFGDEPAANAKDFVLGRIADPRRRQTLIATHDVSAAVARYALDIHLQGDNETVFFDV